MNPDILKLLEQAKEYAKTYRAEADNAGSACGDGRFTHRQSLGFMRAFGGDEGFEAAIIGAQNEAFNQGRITKKLTPEQIDEVYSEKIKQLRGASAVAGAHDDDSHHEVGCGFMGLAMEGLHNHFSPEEAKRLHRVVLDRLNGKQTVLSGKHDEIAVLFINSEKYSVDSRDESTGRMYFVVDVLRSRNFIAQIAPLMGIEGLTADDVWNEFCSQMLKTVQQLASGKEIFELTYDDNNDAENNFTIKPLEKGSLSLRQ